MFARLRDWLRSTSPRPELTTWEVDHDSGGYRIGDSLIPRSDITHIFAFKRDLLVIDQLCVGIRFGESTDHERRDAHCIEEDNSNFGCVLADLQAHFELQPDWRKKVELPPFEENWTMLWARKTPPGTSSFETDSTRRSS